MSNPIIEAARAQGRTLLNEVEAKTILAEAGVPVTPTKLATSPDEAVTVAAEMGYPVALKVVSEAITHKSDIGGVELNLADEAAVRAAFDRIAAAAEAAAPGAAMDGVSVQPMAKAGTEVIMGMTMDQQFGPVLMFGLGGVMVEVLKDVAFRVVPLEPRDAKQMLREIQGFPVLDGYRGSDPADLDTLESILLKLSAFAEANPEVNELDLNPVFAYADGAVAVDARIVLAETSV
ncbi:MAG: acetate--CoA ligase family protein [Chloroflexi bacterium]|nr:acetate--CoA ligase family protein [Chloroflexota bacterium]